MLHAGPLPSPKLTPYLTKGNGYGPTDNKRDTAHLLHAPNFKRDAQENVGSHPTRNPSPRALQKINFRERGLPKQQISRRANPRNAQNRVGTPTTTNSG